MTCDRFYFLQKFLRFNGKANSSYDPNDLRKGFCHQVCLFTDMELCRKLYYPKKQQLHFKEYIKIKRVCFGKKLYKLTSSNGTALNSSVQLRAGKGCSTMGIRISDMSETERTPFYQIFFSLTGNTQYTTSLR